LEDAFFHACLGAYLVGMLMRWWGGVWVQGLRESCAERAAVAKTDEDRQGTPLVSERS